ncbi:MAG: NnrS family protein, partial [Magnetococcales bacterium]|nr:NnrS family protein [Magnetococcales bacterium]
MPGFIHALFPPDPPLSPMTFSRLPVVHRFWLGGIAGALFGFALGFLLWAWQQGELPATPLYPQVKLWHARTQILLFLGSFLLGFALQSGPHVVGGPPPPSRALLRLLPLLWLGFGVSLIPHDGLTGVGNLLISGACLIAAWLLLRITLQGDPLRRLPRGIPLALSLLPLAIAPWLPLEQAETALWVLWCGPVTTALVAAQQLIHNVLGGRLLHGRVAHLFAAALLSAWLLSTLAAFADASYWPWAALAWLAVLTTLILGSHFVQAVWRFGWASISLTLLLGLATALVCALGLTQPGLPLDAVLHLLGAGTMTSLILGVVARVARFFSGASVLSDRLLSLLLLLWNLVVLSRIATALGWPLPEPGLRISIASGALLLTLWSFRVALRLWQIER